MNWPEVALRRCPRQHHRVLIPAPPRRVDRFEDKHQSIGRLRSRSRSAEHTEFDSAAFQRMYGVRGRLYAACPNSGTCDNTIVRMRSNMFWCTTCWNHRSQRNCRAESLNCEEMKPAWCFLACAEVKGFASNCLCQTLHSAVS